MAVTIDDLLLDYCTVYASSNIMGADIVSTPSCHLFYTRTTRRPRAFTLFESSPLCRCNLRRIASCRTHRYLHVVGRRDPRFFACISHFGADRLMNDPIITPCSRLSILTPAAMQCVGVTSSMRELFNSLSNLSVLRVNNNCNKRYGVLTSLCAFGSCAVISLPRPLTLARTFLTTYGIRGIALLSTRRRLPIRSCSLIVDGCTLSRYSVRMRRHCVSRLLHRTAEKCLAYGILPRRRVGIPCRRRLLRVLTRTCVPCALLTRRPLAG